VSYDVAGKVTLITGANRGIGKAIAESFMDHGAAKIYAAVRTLDSAAPLVEKYGDNVVPVRIDLSDAESIEAAAAAAGDTEVVVNNAGVLTTSTPLADDALESLAYEMDINVYGLMRVAQAFAPVLKANRGGVFAQLNSVASMKSFPDFSTYCASKAAAYSITQSLREILAGQGTIVLSVHPGPIATDMGDAAGLTEIAEPASLVADAIIAALRVGEFHVFPDSVAKQLGGAYASFAGTVVETNLPEG
jgi:NAD(P)-dependent dehydrogenase (short-subunit alcohol dehydrogenase family)